MSVNATTPLENRSTCEPLQALYVQERALQNQSYCLEGPQIQIPTMPSLKVQESSEYSVR